MSPDTVGAFSHAIAAAAFLTLFALIALRWRTHSHAPMFAVASALTCLWAAAAINHGPGTGVTEALRTAAWLVVLVLLTHAPRAHRAVMVGGIGALCVAGAALPTGLAAMTVRLIQAVLGMLLIEHVYRSTPAGERWGIKFACLGFGTLFAYDFFLYSDAALFGHVSDDIWAARGLVDALAVPLLAVSIARNAHWCVPLALSRTLLFHSAALIGSAVYLLTMAMSGYYLRLVGGGWGRIMQLVFLCGAAIVLGGVLFSGALRARLKVLIGKHLYQERFDYRHEWLRFTRALSEDGPAPGERAVAAVAGLVESPAGALWIAGEKGSYTPAAHWNMPRSPHGLAADEPFCRFLERRQWVVDVAECAGQPQRYAQLAVPACLMNLPSVWLVVPLILHGRLFGLIALARPRTPITLNWEVRDVLRIAGSQAASYLGHRESADSLMVARQFESFNRMSTFIVHDLKNLVFQFSLLLANAEKHQGNPQFQADLLSTLEHSVGKMKTLLQKLSRPHSEQPLAPLPLDAVVRRALAAKALAEPRPSFESAHGPLTVLANWGRLERVIGHLVQNAIEASARDATVLVRLLREGGHAVLEVCDHGHGMSEQFVRERLFRPFESTKVAGMGIGVFESREYIRELGGMLEVISGESVGTTFRVLLPIHTQGESCDEQAQAAGGGR